MPDRTLADRPVRGDHPKYSQNDMPAQQPIAAFLAKLDALFAFPEVEAIRWEQYTPYFNDGEVCTFNIYDAYIKFVGVDEGGDGEDGFSDDGKSYPPGYFDTHYNSYDYRQRYDPKLREYVYIESPPTDKLPDDWNDQGFYVNGVLRPDIESAFKAVSSAITSEVHAVDFLDVFGDPAQVTATRDGFDVEDYDHE